MNQRCSSQSSLNQTVRFRYSGQAIDQDYYINNCLESAIEELSKERPISRTKDIKLLHDYSKPHVTKDVLFFIGEKDQFDARSSLSSRHLSMRFRVLWLEKKGLTDQTDEDSLFNAVSNIVLNIPKKELKKLFMCFLKERNYVLIMKVSLSIWFNKILSLSRSFIHSFIRDIVSDPYSL